MGLLLSVALGKEKLYAGGCGGRRAVRARVGAEAVGAGVHGGGGSSAYTVLGGHDVLGVGEEKAAAAAAVSTGVESGGAAEAAEVAAASGGTPARPIWQRRVLMGVKCQLPRFSGMILYDERGRPVRSGGVARDRDRALDQEKHAAAISVLRDML
ncbi:hypothetical protein BS78_07G186000 [Paspalum vaginatum]|nr:hypothetical protein BS78_07G186000 [Paspalum vaginatum]